jgi:hypothetical protein
LNSRIFLEIPDYSIYGEGMYHDDELQKMDVNLGRLFDVTLSRASDMGLSVLP